jgi:hypothetical protein
MTTATLDPTVEIPLPDMSTEPAPAGVEHQHQEDAVADPEAPWGRTADGKPRAKPGRKPKGTPRSAAAPRKRTSSAKPRKDDGPDYRPGLTALLQLPAFGLSMAARVVREEKQRVALIADGMALKLHAPGIAEALHETAKQEARLAAILDRVLAAGPYGLIFAAVTPLVMQILANHRVIAPNPMMGVLPVEDLARAAESAG